MAEIVLRVRLVSGEHLDVTYDEAGGTADEIVEHVISYAAALCVLWTMRGDAAGSERRFAMF